MRNVCFLNNLLLGQVDLWTRTPSGCSCSWENANIVSGANVNDVISGNATTISDQQPRDEQKCACCVKGGCPCGISSPARCGQCGLEQHCVNSKFCAKH